MSATAKNRASIERTVHPHIVRSADTLGGDARIDGTRIPVWLIAGFAESGISVHEIIEDYPSLTPAQVYDALSYAYDHPEEIAAERDRHRLRIILKANDLRYYRGELLTAEQLAARQLPPDAAVYTWETLPPDLDE